MCRVPLVTKHSQINKAASLFVTVRVGNQVKKKMKARLHKKSLSSALTFRGWKDTYHNSVTSFRHIWCKEILFNLNFVTLFSSMFPLTLDSCNKHHISFQFYLKDVFSMAQSTQRIYRIWSLQFLFHVMQSLKLGDNSALLYHCTWNLILQQEYLGILWLHFER